MNDVSPCIHLTGLQIETEGHPEFRDLSFSVESGALAAIVGRNHGSWIVLLRILAGMRSLPGGQLELWGNPITAIDRRSLNQLISFVSHSQHPVFHYTVEEFIMQGCESRLKPLQSPGEHEYEKARQIVSQLNIEKLIRRDSSMLSDGELQLVSLARVLMEDTRLMLLEDPVCHLPQETQAEIMSMLLDLTRQQGKTILVTLKDPELALKLADQLIIFDDNGIADILFRHQPTFYEEANAVLQRLLTLDSEGRLIELPSNRNCSDMIDRLF